MEPSFINVLSRFARRVLRVVVCNLAQRLLTQPFESLADDRVVLGMRERKIGQVFVFPRRLVFTATTPRRIYYTCASTGG